MQGWLRRRAQGHSQHGCRGLSGRMRAFRGLGNRCRLSRRDVQLIGFPGCFPNEYAARMMERLCTHPNVGAVLFVSLGCESFDKVRVAAAVQASGRPVRTLVIQKSAALAPPFARVRTGWESALAEVAGVPRVPMAVSDLVIARSAAGRTAPRAFRQPGGGPRLRPAGGRRRRLHL